MTEQGRKNPFESFPTSDQLRDHLTTVLTRYLVQKGYKSDGQKELPIPIEDKLRGLIRVNDDYDIFPGDKLITKRTAVKFLMGEIGLSTIRSYALTIIDIPRRFRNRKFMTNEGLKDRKDLCNYFSLRRILSICGPLDGSRLYDSWLFEYNGFLLYPLQEYKLPLTESPYNINSPSFSIVREDFIVKEEDGKSESVNLEPLIEYGAIDVTTLRDMLIKDWLKNVGKRFKVQTIKPNERFVNKFPKRNIGFYFDENGTMVPFRLQQSRIDAKNSSSADTLFVRLDPISLETDLGSLDYFDSNTKVFFVRKEDYLKLLKERTLLEPEFNKSLGHIIFEAFYKATRNLDIGNY